MFIRTRGGYRCREDAVIKLVNWQKRRCIIFSKARVTMEDAYFFFLSYSWREGFLHSENQFTAPGLCSLSESKTPAQRERESRLGFFGQVLLAEHLPPEDAPLHLSPAIFAFKSTHDLPSLFHRHSRAGSHRADFCVYICLMPSYTHIYKHQVNDES